MKNRTIAEGTQIKAVLDAAETAPALGGGQPVVGKWPADNTVEPYMVKICPDGQVPEFVGADRRVGQSRDITYVGPGAPVLLGGRSSGDLLVVKSGRFQKAGAGDLCVCTASADGALGDVIAAAPAHQDGLVTGIDPHGRARRWPRGPQLSTREGRPWYHTIPQDVAVAARDVRYADPAPGRPRPRCGPPGCGSCRQFEDTSTGASRPARDARQAFSSLDLCPLDARFGRHGVLVQGLQALLVSKGLPTIVPNSPGSTHPS